MLPWIAATVSAPFSWEECKGSAIGAQKIATAPTKASGREYQCLPPRSVKSNARRRHTAHAMTAALTSTSPPQGAKCPKGVVTWG